MQLFSCDNPRVMFSTARPLDRQNAYVARAFSISPNPEKALFGFGEKRRAGLVDLAVRRLHVDRLEGRRSGEVAVNLRPFEIVTFRVVSRSQSEKKFRATVVKILIDKKFALHLALAPFARRFINQGADPRRRKKSA